MRCLSTDETAASPFRQTPFPKSAASRSRPEVGGGRLPVISGKEVIRALNRAGFVVERIVGSHHVLVHPDDPRHTVTVPVHGNRDLKPGTLRAIIRQSGLTVEEFSKLL